MDLGISGRVALVAGASRGIGRACALSLAREGADVALIARDAAALQGVAREISAAGRRAIAIPCDVTHRASLRAAVSHTTTTLGAPTLLVLAVAAIYAPKKLANVDDAETDALLDADIKSNVDLCRLTLEGMMDARFGRIVAIGSVAAHTGVSGGALYSAGKAALEGLTRGIALDYGRRGITANVVSVSFAATERLETRVAHDEGARERLVRATAIRRIPTPAEVADIVTFLCSSQASIITGTVVEATAGAHLNNLW
jgi:3-oxoacyl-[acyl-carrier protein] reductase